MSTKILAVDTATENCSVALMIGDDVISRCEYAPREHTTKILPMIDAVMAEAGIKLKQLDALAYGRGPGSFTGVRIGIGIAQGLTFISCRQRTSGCAWSIQFKTASNLTRIEFTFQVAIFMLCYFPIVHLE